MKDPAFLFYSSDFLSGVSDLTMEERGQFITLLCLQHQKGALNEKTIRLSVGSCSVDVLKKFSQDENGNFYNERLVLEIEKRNNFTESRRNNGLKGGRPKKEEKPLGLHKDNHMANHMGNENENVNRSINDNVNSTTGGKKIKKEIVKEIPTIQEFMTYGKENKEDVSEQALELKYKSWVENDWKTGKGTAIKNWKSTLLNTLPHLPNKNLQNNNNLQNNPFFE